MVMTVWLNVTWWVVSSNALFKNMDYEFEF